MKFPGSKTLLLAELKIHKIKLIHFPASSRIKSSLKTALWWAQNEGILSFYKKMKFGSHRHICDFSQNTFFGWHFLSSNDAVPDRGEWWPLLWATEAHKPSEWRPKTVIHPPPMSFHPFKFLSNSTYPWWYSPSMVVRRNHFSFSKIFQIQVRHCHKN